MSMALRRDVSRATRAAGNAKPVDLVHLSSQALGDPELEREVLGIFLNHAQVYLDAWKAASSANARKHAAHSLKGAARSIGAWELAEIAETAEEKNFPVRAKLESELRRVCEYIRSLD